MKRHKRKQNVLILITAVLLVAAIFLSIYEDGIKVGLNVMLPFSFLILIIAIISLILGYKHRKEFKPWYVHGLIIISMGIIVLWTPILKTSRSFVERNWRWDSRNEVVEDIKSGNLIRYEGIEEKQIAGYDEYYVFVPLEKYGRVSFEEVYGNDNAVEVAITPETGFMIIFTTDGGFFGPKSQLIYVEKEFPNDSFYSRLDDHWFLHKKEFSLFVN